MTRRVVQDPVCGMRFEPHEASATTEIEGRKYYFCCAGCLRSFEADPKRYLRRDEEGQDG